MIQTWVGYRPSKLRPSCAHTPHVVDAARAASLHFRVTSVNVLTLSDSTEARNAAKKRNGLLKQATKPYLFAKSLEEAGIHAAAIQESRCEAGCTVTGGFLKYFPGHLGGGSAQRGG